jgi:hypothetical protein
MDKRTERETGDRDRGIESDFSDNSIQFFIICVPREQLQGQLETPHSVGTGKCIMYKYSRKSKVNYGKVLEGKHNKTEKQTNRTKGNKI